MAERSVMGRTSDILANSGVVDLSLSLGFDLVFLDDLNPDGWKDIRAQGLHCKHGFRIARIFTDAQKVVETFCLETHRLGGDFTVRLKNSVGAVAARPKGSSYDYMRGLHSSPFQGLMVAEINAFYRTDLVLMDAAKDFVTGGSEAGDAVEPGLLLASNNRVAVDAVGVTTLSYYGTTTEASHDRIFEQEQIARAASLGVGARSADRIELVPLN